ncbi:MAG: Ig-like domain-containing protein, partial [Bacteroidales bacterium]|nr:Ig-like domain-containing protein [Bacteroidales bacterium]
ASDGTYLIDSIPPGYISIRTYKPGYGSKSKNISLANEGTGNIDFELETPAPYIVQITPQADSIINDLSTAIVVTFSQEMDSLTFNHVNVIFSDREKTLSGKITRTLTGFSFQPDSLLENAMTYTVTITSGVKNVPGISLGQDYVWSFKTFDPTLDVSPLAIQDPLEVFYNPSSDEITVTYILDHVSQVNAGIYSIVGLKQLDLESGMKDSGKHCVTINADNLLNGLYILKIDLGDKSYTKKLIIKR